MGRVLRKLIILALIFISVIGVFIWKNRESEHGRTYEEMGGAGLPLVELLYEGRVVNELHGYTSRIEADTVRETIYPLTQDCRIDLRIKTFGVGVASVGYEVRSLDGKRLIERSKTEDLFPDGEGIVAGQITLMDLLEQQQEYMVTFTLYTQSGQECANYYTRVTPADGELVSGAIQFALNFSDSTFKGEPDEEMIAQLESRAGADNSSFGYTDIYSSYSHVLWGELRPERKDDVRISLYEIGRLMTSLVLRYTVCAQDAEGNSEDYAVEEFYGVRYVGDRYYLMTYERQAGQRYAGEIGPETADGALQLGVVRAEDLPVQTMRKGNRTAFVYNGRLWCYDAGTDVLRTLFTFSTGGDDARAGYDQHGIRIIRMEDGGDVEFIVYGYMNRGDHEGQTGIAYYRYLAEEDALQEVFYITSGRSYQRIKEELGVLSYMSGNGLFYLMYNGTVYAIDIESGEYVELATGIGSTALSVGAEGGIAAWQERSENGMGDSITVYYLDSGESRILTAPEGEYMALKGFVNGDLLYGLISEKDREEAYPYSVNYPVYALEIVGTDGTLISRYEQENVYLTNVEIMPDRVSFGRVRVRDGVWEQMEGDMLFFAREEDGGDSSALLAASSSSGRQKRTYRLMLGMTEKTEIRGKCPRVMEGGTLRIDLGAASESEGGRYFAYSHGRLQGIFGTVSSAVACIEPDMGVVVNGRQEMVWNRGNRETSGRVTMPSWEMSGGFGTADCLNLFLKKLGADADCGEEAASGENILRILQNHTDRTVLNLEGCTVSEILYYLYEGVPVIGVTGENRLALIVGYTESRGEGELTLYSPGEGQEVKIDFEQAEEWFGISGNRFISAIP